MTMLLSRYAEALFWFARYVERSASLARILNVQAAHYQGQEDDVNWKAILALYANEGRYAKVHGDPTPENIVKFYITDREHGGSISSSIAAARENARLLRPLISVSMWSYVNVFHNQMKRLTEWDLHASQLSRTCARIAEQCDAILGVTEGTYYRDAGWRFYQLGLWIERADQTSRLLDVKYAQFATEIKSEQPPAGDFWHMLLRSFEAYHAFQRVESGRMDPRHIADFLMFNQSFPRSLTHCIGEIQHMLHDLYMGYHLRQTSRVSEKMELLLYELEAASKDPLLHERFHGFNDMVQNRLSDLTDQLGQIFFGHQETPEIDKAMGGAAPETADRPDQTQSQSQTQGESQVSSLRQSEKKTR